MRFPLRLCTLGEKKRKENSLLGKCMFGLGLLFMKVDLYRNHFYKNKIVLISFNAMLCK